MINYRRSIVNITNSFYKHYKTKMYHSSLEELDTLLKKNYKHVFLLLTDGLGVGVINQHLDADAFLRRHQVSTLSSVFPPTTVAATASIISGETPYEHGHLGWFQYFKDEDFYYTVFLEEDYYSLKKVPEDFPYQFGYAYFTDRIKKQHPHLLTRVFYPKPVDPNGYERFEEGLDLCLKTAQLDQETLVYCYYIEPDKTMHEFGPNSSEAKQVVQALNAQLEAFYAKLPKDSLVVLTADHGMIDVEPIDILNHPIMDTLSAKPSNEPRATVFHVKDHENFNSLFEKDYAMYFDLYTTKEFLEKGFLGNGKEHRHIELCLGDYVAIAKRNKYFNLSEETLFKGHHAGITDKELMVPLIVFSKE